MLPKHRSVETLPVYGPRKHGRLQLLCTVATVIVVFDAYGHGFDYPSAMSRIFTSKYNVLPARGWLKSSTTASVLMAATRG